MRAAVTGAFSVAERIYPMSEVRGRSQEDPMPQGRRPRGVTPHPRSGAAAKSARLRRRRNAREKLPLVRAQGRWLGGATPRPRSGGCTGVGVPRGTIPRSRSEGAAVKRFPTSKIRETQVRRQVLQGGIRRETHRNHTHRKLVNPITLGPQPCLTQ